MVQVSLKSFPLRVTSISVIRAGGLSSITVDNGTLQLNTTVIPANATNNTVTWSITNGTGQATISQTGLVTAQANGTFTATATANDGSGKSGQLLIDITNQTIHVTNIEIEGEGGDLGFSIHWLL